MLMSLQIKEARYKYWSKREVALLKKLYPKLWVKDLVKFFPERNKATITAKALDLELPSAKSWQPRENLILKKHFAVESEKVLTQLLPRRSWKAILAQGERLELLRERTGPRLKVNEYYFKKWSANMAYLLGYILTDGCITKGTYKGYSDVLKFGVQKSDIDILKKIRKELTSEHAISIVRNAAHLSITSQKIVDDLKLLGIIYRKSLREKVPEVPARFVKDFIRGIVDGDGKIKLEKDGYPALSIYGGIKTIRFVRDYFLSTFKIRSKIYRRKKSKDKKHYLYSISYRTTSAKTLITYLYKSAQLYIERKFQQAKKCMNTVIKYKPNYTIEEDKILRENYLTSPLLNMTSLLTGRSKSSIEQRARSLGLYKYTHK